MRSPLENLRETLIIPDGCRERFLPLEAPAARPLIDVGVMMAGLSDLGPGYRVVRRQPDFHTLVYALDGSAVLTNPARHELEANQVFVSGSGQPYAYHSTRARWRIAWFMLRDLPDWAGLPRPGQVRATADAAPIRACMEGFAQAAMREPNGRKALLWAELIREYLLGERDAGEEPRERRLRDELSTLWGRVDADLGRQWDVVGLARLAGLSTSHFHREVLRIEGTSPLRVVTRLRMRRAAEMLLHTPSSVEQVALRVGYESAFAFSSAFRRHLGVSPRAYRQHGHSRPR